MRIHANRCLALMIAVAALPAIRCTPAAAQQGPLDPVPFRAPSKAAASSAARRSASAALSSMTAFRSLRRCRMASHRRWMTVAAHNLRTSICSRWAGQSDRAGGQGSRIGHVGRAVG